MVPGRYEDRRAPGGIEDVHRKGQRLGVHALLVEQVAGNQDRMHAALDRDPYRGLERPLLVAPPLLAAFGRQPPERGAEVEIGDLEEFR